jgi:hypothetical protein
MAPSIFLDRESPPSDRQLEAALGTQSALWTELRAKLAAAFAPVSAKWSFSGKSHGWILQLRQKQRTILYLVPGQGSFVASFALSDKACEAARRSGLPARLLAIVDDAPKYAEGRGVRLEVRTKKAVANVEALASIKMAN